MQNKVVIVTGGAAGIGRATVARFAHAGAHVAIWDVDEARGNAFVHELAAQELSAVFARVDVTSSQNVNAAVADVVSRWGRIDVLVNNAGIVRDQQLAKFKDGALVATMSDETFDVVINVNLKGVFYCTRAVVPHMVAQGGGVVLNASSVVGLYGNFGQTNYSATKGAVITMTKTWARELGKFKVRVNCVCPGFIGTEILRSMPEKVLESMVQRTPIGRMGQPEDIANAYYWLASDEASFVHGTVLSVDGGLVMGT